MMKRKRGIALLAVLGLMSTGGYIVSAADTSSDVSGTTSASQTADVQISYDVPFKYTVTIPTALTLTLNLEKTKVTGEAEVKIHDTTDKPFNINFGKKLTVGIVTTSVLSLVQSEGDTTGVTYQIFKGTSSSHSGEIKSDSPEITSLAAVGINGGVTQGIYFEANAPKYAGSYGATLSFVINPNAEVA
ncbi:MAG: hypothetical protein LBS33_04040 [Streptococcaceae bacterium]|jgi:hypothetical protein|nr:hypothetical protein [Streptococcaceae bacterium]